MAAAAGDPGSPKAVLEAIGKFDKMDLQHIVPKEKVVLPTAEAIQQEKTEKQLLEEIEQSHDLKPTETAIKNPLPSKEVIEKEKTEKRLLEEIEQDHDLKHVTPKIKNPLPSKEDIQSEKAAK